MLKKFNLNCTQKIVEDFRIKQQMLHFYRSLSQEIGSKQISYKLPEEPETLDYISVNLKTRL